MRRCILSPAAGRASAHALRSQARRTFAAPPIKDKTTPAPIEPSKEQAMPIGLYYEIILNNPQPIPQEKPEAPPPTAEPEKPPPSATPPPPTPPRSTPPRSTPKTQRGRKPKEPSKGAASNTFEPQTSTTDDAQARARIIFGSRLAGPAERAERLAAIKKKTRRIAGVLVPPKPEEPDNCCMSGCVNCVWDRFRDEMEEWAAASTEAEQRLRAQEAGVAAAADSMTKPSTPTVDRGAISMDDDGGGSAGNWGVGEIHQQGAGTKLAKDFWDDELYKNVPVGIREFMKQEKKLKEKHIQEGTSGG